LKILVVISCKARQLPVILSKIVLPLQHFASDVLAEIIRRQPASKERTAFAWSVAVGPALARATTVNLSDEVLVIRAKDPRWAREIDRARDTILARLQTLLGPEALRDLRVLRD
jgi:predicted nucleic acid-binding Zn ribbon protein